MMRVLRSTYTHAIAVYIAVRLLGIAVLAALATQHDAELLGWLTAWDGSWYLALAEHGYDGIGDGDGFLDGRGEFMPGITPLAFFPLYPALVSTVAALPGVSIVAAALAVNVVAGAVAACGIVRITRTLAYGPRVGLTLVALVSGAPMAISLSMTYTEAVFVALAVWALAFLVERQWILAALCCVGAGLTRSTATVLIAAVVLAALVAAWRGRDRGAAITCALIAPLGLAAFWAHVATRTGSLHGWFEVQQGWHTEIDGGARTIAWIGDTLTTGPSVMEVGAVVILLGAGVLVAAGVVARVPWPLLAYGAGFLLLLIAMTGYQYAKPRFLLPAAVVLLLPIAIGLARRHTATLITSTLGLTLLGSWYSAHSLVNWPYSM